MDTNDLVLLYDYYGDLLTERQKECFELRYYQDLSLGEIAVEDIPEQVEELKALGLDEVLAVRTAQYNRGIGK